MLQRKEHIVTVNKLKNISFDIALRCVRSVLTKLQYAVLALLFFCSNQITERPRLIPLDSLNEYGLRIAKGDIYKYRLINGYNGPNYLYSSGAERISLFEDAALDAAINDIYQTEKGATMMISVTYKGVRVVTEVDQSRAKTLVIDSIYSGVIEFSDSTFKQEIDGFSIGLFDEYVIGSAHQDGQLIVLGDTLHYKEGTSIFNIDTNKTLSKRLRTLSSFNSAAFFIVEKAILLRYEISIIADFGDQAYTLDLISVNGRDITYPPGMKPEKFISR